MSQDRLATTHCSTLQHAATHDNTLHMHIHGRNMTHERTKKLGGCGRGRGWVTLYMHTRRRVTTWVKIHSLQRTAAHCNMLQHTATHCICTYVDKSRPESRETHCNILQHTAAHCHTQHHTATHCICTHTSTSHETSQNRMLGVTLPYTRGGEDTHASPNASRRIVR